MPFHDNSLLFLSNLGPGTRFSLQATVRQTVFALKCFRRHICCSKVRKSAQGCSKCKIVLQTQKSAQKVLSAIGKGLSVDFRDREKKKEVGHLLNLEK